MYRGLAVAAVVVTIAALFTACADGERGYRDDACSETTDELALAAAAAPQRTSGGHGSSGGSRGGSTTSGSTTTSGGQGAPKVKPGSGGVHVDIGVVGVDVDDCDDD